MRGCCAISSARGRFAFPENSFSSDAMICPHLVALLPAESTQPSPRDGLWPPLSSRATLRLEDQILHTLQLLQTLEVAGAGGIEPPLRGPKPRVLPLDDAPVNQIARMAAPEFVRTAQAAQPARLTRRWICCAWSSDRAMPNTVGPLPDITAPSVPAASSAAFMRPITGIAGSA